MDPVFLFLIGKLVLPFCCRRSLAFGIRKDMDLGKAAGLSKGQGLGKVSFRLPRESDYDIRCNGYIRNSCTEPMNELLEAGCVLRPVHRL